MNIESGGLIGISRGSGAGVGAGVICGGRFGGVEVGGLAGAASVSGPAISAGGSAFEAAPVKGISTSIVNEGPVGFADLKATIPLLGTDSTLVIARTPPLAGDVAILTNIDSHARPSASLGLTASEKLVPEHPGCWSIDVLSVIAEAEAILAQARNPAIHSSVIPAKAGIHINNLWIPNRAPYWHEPDGHTLIRSSASTGVIFATENATAVEGNVVNDQERETEISGKVAKEQPTEEIVSERTPDKQIAIVKTEVIRKKKFVVDKPTLAQRLGEVKLAVQQARLEAEKLGYGQKIIGRILEKFMVLTDPKHLSKAVRPDGPDGTLSIIRETIKARAEFHSAEEVEAVVLKNRPVSIEEEGERVSDEEVRRVFSNRIVKPASQAAEIVESRTIKKAQQLPTHSAGVNTIPPHSSLSQRAHPSESKTQGWTEAKLETNLEDLGLAEVFKKY